MSYVAILKNIHKLKRLVFRSFKPQKYIIAFSYQRYLVLAVRKFYITGTFMYFVLLTRSNSKVIPW